MKLVLLEIFSEMYLPTEKYKQIILQEFKALLKVIPIWSTGAIMSINVSQPSLPLLQATSMDRHIMPSFEFPAGSFGMLSVLSIALWVALYDRIILSLTSKITGKPISFTTKQRIGMGIFVSFPSMAVAWGYLCHFCPWQSQPL